MLDFSTIAKGNADMRRASDAGIDMASSWMHQQVGNARDWTHQQVDKARIWAREQVDNAVNWANPQFGDWANQQIDNASNALKGFAGWWF